MGQVARGATAAEAPNIVHPSGAGLIITYEVPTS
jgi:hypothetical protein